MPGPTPGLQDDGQSAGRRNDGPIFADRFQCSSRNRLRPKPKPPAGTGVASGGRAQRLAQRDKGLVEIFLALEPRLKFKGFTKINSLAHADAMPNLRFYLSGNYVRIVAFDF
jgi:hypothetical protein